MNTFTVIDFLVMILASSGSAASLLLWGRWGPPVLFLATATLALIVAVSVELLAQVNGGPGGHEAFWANIMLFKWGFLIWWMLAIPLIIIVVILRAIRQPQVLRT